MKKDTVEIRPCFFHPSPSDTPILDGQMLWDSLLHIGARFPQSSIIFDTDKFYRRWVSDRLHKHRKSDD